MDVSNERRSRPSVLTQRSTQGRPCDRLTEHPNGEGAQDEARPMSSSSIDERDYGHGSAGQRVRGGTGVAGVTLTRAGEEAERGCQGDESCHGFEDLDGMTD